MSDTTKNAFISGIAFGVVMGAVFSLIGGVSSGIAAGIISGILFAASTGVITRRLARKFAESRSEIVGDKPVIMEGPANHFRGIEGVGGWLFLTTEQLIFKPHSVNIQKHQWTVRLDEVSEVRTVKTWGIIANGLQVTLSDDHGERFVVNRSQKWVEKISETRARLRE